MIFSTNKTRNLLDTAKTTYFVGIDINSMYLLK